jgi:hypothetical protein
MRTIKTYSKRAPFYNAFVDTNPTGYEPRYVNRWP